MQTTSTDSSIHFHETDTADDALEVRVLWGSELLQVTHLSPPRPFVVGESDDTDFTLPASVLGSMREEIPMRDGAHTAGGLIFQVRNVASATRVGGATPNVQSMVREHRWLVASLACHAVFLALFALMPPSASAISIGDLRADQRYIEMVTIPDAREEEETPEFLRDNTDRGQEGKAHDGEQGAMGDREAPKRKARAGVKGEPDEPDPVLARERMIEEATSGGLIGVLRASAHKYDGPTSPYGADMARGRDPMSALASLLGPQIAQGYGQGGLGMIGTGRGAGGTSKGTLGIGDLNTIGRDGTGNSGGMAGALSMRKKPKTDRVPRIRPAKPDIAGGLSKETIRRYIRRQLPQVRHCYEQTLRERPDLQGRVAVRFMIDPTGVVRVAMPTRSTLGHGPTERCVANAVKRITFPRPEGGGMVKVTYPFVLERI
ncbi:MAG: AgmX/PglI C-terminal domain-containing protein [Myxococcales bacterium]|nr:AgmX/PglI C-terminal domain-containing protein [Myxococcales bacterium]